MAFAEKAVTTKANPLADKDPKEYNESALLVCEDLIRLENCSGVGDEFD